VAGGKYCRVEWEMCDTKSKNCAGGDGVRQTVSGIRQNADDQYFNFVQALLFEYSPEGE